MKRSLYILFVIYACIFSPLYADPIDLWEWPIKGAKRGSDLLMDPETPIHNRYRDIEEPFGGYVIAGEPGTPVVAVESGRLAAVRYSYAPDFLTSVGDESYDGIRRYVEKQDPDAAKWIHRSLAIELGPGHMVWYIGLEAPAHIEHREGENVKRGDVIGRVGYGYRTIDTPSIGITYDIAGKRGDPGPFMMGVSTRQDAEVEFERFNYRTGLHSPEELIADIGLIYDSITTAHPAPFQYTTPDELRKAYDTALESISGPLTSDQFFKIAMPVVRTIRDNHAYISRTYTSDADMLYEPRTELPVEIGYVKGRCYLLTQSPAGAPAGTEVVAIDREPVTDIYRRLTGYTSAGDGAITSREELELSRYATSYLLLDGEWPVGYGLTFEFADGTIEEITISGTDTAPTRQRATEPFTVRRIDEKTVLIRVIGMFFTDTDRDEFSRAMEETIEDHMPNLILDLRGNMGGEIGDSYHIFSHFAPEPFYHGDYNRVATNGMYEIAVHTENLVPGEAYYAGYHDDGAGYILTRDDDIDSFTCIEPRPQRYRGDVYVLTNGFTGSAAVALASFFHRFECGTIIGTQGSNGYHRMTGIDFAKIRLGRTGLIFNLPLIQMAFLTETDSDIPTELGVIPDIEVRYEIEDILKHADLELEKATEIIAAKRNRKPILPGVLALCAVLAAGALAFVIRKRYRPVEAAK